MAKIITSALIDGISGKLGGSILRTTKRGVTIGHGYKPHPTKSDLQMATRGYVNDLTTSWSKLTATQKTLWDQFASQSRGEPTGFHAFVELNANLLQANYSTLVIQSTPPIVPATPPMIKNLFAQEVGNTTTCISWTSPDYSNIFCKVYMCVKTGSKSSCRLLRTVPSSNLYTEHNYNYPTGTVVYYKVRSILPDGRQGPYSFTPPIGLPITTVFFSNIYNNQVCAFYGEYLEECLRALDITSTPGHDFYPTNTAIDENYLYTTDSSAEKFYKWDKRTLKLLATYSNVGRPEDEHVHSIFSLCSDNTYLYVCANVCKIIKVRISDFVYMAKYNPVAPDPNQFVFAEGITVSGSYIYFTTVGPDGLYKLQKSDLAFVSSLTGTGSGDSTFSGPRDLRVINNELYLCDKNNDRIKVHSPVDLFYIREYQYSVRAGSQYTEPWGIDFDSNYIYISNCDDLHQHIRITKHVLSTFLYITGFGSVGVGKNQYLEIRNLVTWHE